MRLFYLGTELGFEVEGGKYNFFEESKYNFSWVICKNLKYIPTI